MNCSSNRFGRNPIWIPSKAEKWVMNFLRIVFLSFVYSVLASAQTLTPPGHQDSNVGSVTHIRTSLGHVSLLEFRDPVTAAAAGSKVFRIERFENKVLITPSKAGVSTNLFVWTATQRFSYELDSPGETPTMSLVFDAPAPTPKPNVVLKQQEIQLLAQTLLANGPSGAQRIDSSNIKAGKDAVSVRVELVLRTSETLYIYFTLDNQSKQPFRMIQPLIYRLDPGHSSISLLGLVNHQMDPKLIARVGSTKYVTVPVSDAEFQSGDLSAGAQKAGVIAIPLAPTSPTMLQLVFTDSLRATVVL
jgi:hypothetical protein